MRRVVLSLVVGVAALAAFLLPSTAEAHGFGHPYYRGAYGLYRGPGFYRAPLYVPPVGAYRFGVGAVAPYAPFGGYGAAYGGFNYVAPAYPYGGVRVFGGFVRPAVPGFYP
jgi:hypothetical protein